MSSNAKTWDEQWEHLEQLAGGGQGSAKIVRRKDGSNGKAFLKILNRQNDPECRQRLFREAASLATLKARGTPRFIETNAHHYSELEFQLYIVTEYVGGLNLTEYVVRNDVDIACAFNFSLQLCRILEGCAEQGLLHRDIKPDNIIICGDRRELFLVDFGLAFQDSTDELDTTLIGKEIGNRFLRLNELSPGSSNKRDARSDVASCVGILFFLITGIQPGTLIDGDGAMPHQRKNAKERLTKLPNHLTPALLSIFDRGFQIRLGQRYQSAKMLREDLEAFNTVTLPKGVIGVDLMKRLELKFSSASSQARDLERTLAMINDQVVTVCNNICAQLPFQTGQSLYNLDLKNSLFSDQRWFQYKLDRDAMFRFDYKIVLIGNEVVVEFLIPGNRLEYRVPEVEPILTQAARDEITESILRGLDSLTS